MDTQTGIKDWTYVEYLQGTREGVDTYLFFFFRTMSKESVEKGHKV